MPREPNSNEKSEVVAASGLARQPVARRPYSRPLLVAYGRVEDMTRGGSNTKVKDPGNKPGKP